MDRHEGLELRPISRKHVLGGIWPCEGCGELYPVQASWVARERDGLTLVLCAPCAHIRRPGVAGGEVDLPDFSRLSAAV